MPFSNALWQQGRQSGHIKFALLLTRPLGSPPTIFLLSGIITPDKTLPLVPGPGTAGTP